MCPPVLLAGGLLVAACGSATERGTGNPGPVDTSGVTERITITAREFVLKPAQVTAPKGATVTVVLENDGALAHNLVIEQLGVRTETIQSDERDRVTFTPDVAGDYLIYCDVPGHREAGMTAHLIVR